MRWSLGIVLVLLLCAGEPANAQTTGTIEGVTVDTTGARLSGVTITLQQPTLGVTRVVLTGVNGAFHAPLLPIGVYELTATRDRFRPLRQTNIAVHVGQVGHLRLEMALAERAEQVTVRGNARGLDTSRTHASAVVHGLAIQHLPVNGRSFIDFALLTPGVTRERGGDLSVAGQGGELNSLIVDGADNNNTFFGEPLARIGSGRAPYQFSQDAVQEFQINVNAYGAEHGRAAAGVINVLTRSGTNTLRGSLFDFYRDKALNATNVITRRNGEPKDPYHYHQFGGTLGGPLRRSRDFFFVNYDGQRNRQPNPVFLNLPANTPNDSDTRAALERLRPLAFTWSRRLDQDVVLAKTDHQITGQHRLTVRYNHQNFTGVGLEAPGPLSAFEHTGPSLVRTRTLAAVWAGVFGSRLFNELRWQYARDHEPGEANSDNPEAAIRQSGTLVLVIGRNGFSPRDNRIDRLQIADAITWMHGDHLWKTGVDVQLDRIQNYFPGRFGGRYEFNSLASFHRGRPDGLGESYQQSFAGPGTSGPSTNPSIREYAVFLQDTWRVHSSVTATLGLRYDVMHTDAPEVRNADLQLAAAGIDTGRLERDTNNWGPRLGIAWNPNGRSLVVRGGWGVFYGRIPAIVLAGAHSNNGINVVALRFTGSAVPTYPERFDTIPTGGQALQPALFFIERLANPRLTHANLSIERALTASTTIAATYLLANGTDLSRSIDRNIGTPGQRTFTITGTGETVTYPFFGPDRPFANFQRVTAYSPTAKSMYHGLTIDLRRQFAEDSQLRVAYTLSRVEDTAPEVGASEDGRHPPSPIDDSLNRESGNSDQRHRFVASAVFQTTSIAGKLSGVSRMLSDAWTVSAIVTTQSGLPFSARVGNVDLNSDRNTTNDLAPGTRRNGFRLPALMSLDARIARDIPVGGSARLQLIAEAFNLLNRDNINAVEANYYTVTGTQLTKRTDFAKPIGSAGERIVQLAVRVTF